MWVEFIDSIIWHIICVILVFGRQKPGHFNPPCVWHSVDVWRVDIVFDAPMCKQMHSLRYPPFCLDQYRGISAQVQLYPIENVCEAIDLRVKYWNSLLLGIVWLVNDLPKYNSYNCTDYNVTIINRVKPSGIIMHGKFWCQCVTAQASK